MDLISYLNISQIKYPPFGRRILKISKPCSGGVPDSDQSTWTFTYYVNDASGNVMATYDYERQTDYYSMKLDEQMIYGSSRLGMRKYNNLLSTFTVSGSVLEHEDYDDTLRYLGRKRYEYTNHLGNVLLVTTDRKMGIDRNSDGSDDFYHAVVDAYYDYGPFGNVLDGRKGGSSRFGFQGQEKDDELYGDNNSVNFAFRMHDPRLGRFMSVDPLACVFAYNSPYAFSENRVNDAIELEGLELFFIHGTNHSHYAWYNVPDLLIAIESLTNNTLVDTNFDWCYDDDTGESLNHTTHDHNDRGYAALDLVEHIMEFRQENWEEAHCQEITIAGYSHGGNVAIQAADIIWRRYGIKVNIITINTPVFEEESVPNENPANSPGINDHIHFWTEGDIVAGGVVGDDYYHNDKTRNYMLTGVDWDNDDVWYKPDDHFLQNANYVQIWNCDDKLQPVPEEYKTATVTCEPLEYQGIVED